MYFVFLESAADKPIVVIPDSINKWAGEDEEDDIKVRVLKFKYSTSTPNRSILVVHCQNSILLAGWVSGCVRCIWPTYDTCMFFFCTIASLLSR